MVKRLSDPNAPKRPLSGYFMWMASGVRDKLLSESKGKKVSEVLKTCGDRWRKMPEKEKKFWLDKSKREREAWNKRMTTYKKTKSFSQFEEKKKEAAMMKVKNSKKPKDTSIKKPKRPLSAFFRFVSHFRKNHSEMKVAEMTKVAGAEWKVLSETDKKKYTDAAASDQAKYQKDLAKYKKSNEYKLYQDKVKAFKTKKKLKLRKFNKTKKEEKLSKVDIVTSTIIRQYP